MEKIMYIIQKLQVALTLVKKPGQEGFWSVKIRENDTGFLVGMVKG